MTVYKCATVMYEPTASEYLNKDNALESQSKVMMVV